MHTRLCNKFTKCGCDSHKLLPTKVHIKKVLSGGLY